MTDIDLTLRALHYGELQLAETDGRTAPARREAVPPTTGGPPRPGHPVARPCPGR
jgi:hypothetical protein